MKFIKMCILMFSLSAISLSLAQDSIVYKTMDEMHNMPGENFLPLAKGNKWQHRYIYSGRDLYGWYSYWGIYLTQVLDTISVNNKLYYKINQSCDLDFVPARQYYLRIDRANNKVYKTLSLTPINEFLYFDFNLANGTPYLQGNQIVNAYNNGNERGFTGILPNWTVSNSIGFYNWVDDLSGEVETRLISALVKDSGFSYLIKDVLFEPVWNVTSLSNVINSNKWHIKFELNISGTYLVDYISLYSFYKSDIDSIPNPEIRFHWPYGAPDTTISLDTSLLAQNYKFYYRFGIKKNFVLPIYYYYPQTGYSALTYIADVKNEDLLKLNYSLEQNYPNPFNPTTTINYYVPSESKVNITVYNALGSKVKELVSENKPQGNYEVKFDGAGLASGVYFVTLKAASVDGKQSFVSSKKMILMK